MTALNVLKTAKKKHKTRLNPFARSWFYNATAVRGARWWLRQSHSVNYANHQHSPFARRRHEVANSISPVSFGKSFMKIRSAIPENGSHIFGGWKTKTEKKQKKTKTEKTSVKHIRYRLIDGCVNQYWKWPTLITLADGLKCLFTRTNILIRRFSHCSLNVKLRLFRSFCICFYDIALGGM